MLFQQSSTNVQYMRKSQHCIKIESKFILLIFTFHLIISQLLKFIDLLLEIAQPLGWLFFQQDIFGLFLF